MAVTGKWYGLAFTQILNKEVDWVTDDIRCTLHTVTYVPDQDADDFFNDATNEVVGAGYVANGFALTTTIGYTAGTNVTKLDADDAIWNASTITARVAVVMDFQTAAAATSPLIVYQLSDANVSSTAGTFTVAWHADGIATITPA